MTLPRSQTIFAALAAIGVTLSMVALLVAVLQEEVREGTQAFLLVGAAFFVIGLTGLACQALARRNAPAPLLWPGGIAVMAAGLALLASVLYFLAGHEDARMEAMRIATTAGAGGLLLLGIASSMVRLINSIIGQLARVALIAVSVIALILVVLYGVLGWVRGPMQEPLAAATAVTLVLTGICHGLVAHVAERERQKRSRVGETMAGIRTLEVECPRCHSAWKARLDGVSSCPSCRFSLAIEVEEPLCACGYQLFGLQADSCPECGRPVERWSAGSMSVSAGT